jgi:hypothetical protein
MVHQILVACGRAVGLAVLAGVTTLVHGLVQINYWNIAPGHDLFDKQEFISA